MSEYFEHGKISHSDDISFLFLAPTGAQEVAISVCPSVPLAESCLWHSIFIFQPQILYDDFMMISG